MVVPVIADIVLAAVLYASFVRGRRRGAVRMLWHTFAWLIALIFSVALSAPFGKLVSESEYVNKIRIHTVEKIETSVTENLPADSIINSEYISEVTGIPAVLIPASAVEDAARNGIAGAAKTVADATVNTAVRAASGTILFLLLRIAMSLIYNLLNIASKLPVISGVNHLLGGLMGLIGAVLAVYLVLAAAAVFCIGAQWTDMIENTYLVKYFYNNNILLQLIKL